MNIREPRDFQKVKQKRQRKRSFSKAKRITKALVIFALILVIGGYIAYQQPVQTVNAVVNMPQVPNQPAELAWPAQGSAAVGVMNHDIIAAQGTQSAIPMASIAKVMTALAVLKKQPLKIGETGPSFTITVNDLTLYEEYANKGGSVLPVEVGQQLSEYQALQAILLPSANNIADLLAIWAYGSLENYHTAANKLAQDLGMKNTHFAVDASGFAPETVSTPNDLLLLGEAALSEPVIKEIVAQKSAELPLVGTVYNRNSLLSTEGINGIKTGNTDQAGGCFLFSAEHTLPDTSKVTIVGAVMGAPTLGVAMGSSVPLLKSVKNNFASLPITQANQTVATYSLPWGGAVEAAPDAPITVFAWRGGRPRISINPSKISETAKKGDSVGTITIKTPSGDITRPLVLKQSATQPTNEWRLFGRYL